MTQTSTQLATQIHNNGGFSYSIATDSSPKAGERKFAVAFSKTTERTYPLSSFSPSDLVNYISEHVADLSRAGVHLGAWVDNGVVYLDCSIVVSDYTLAVQIAQENEQIAIFCFENMTSRPVLRVVR